MAFPDAYDSALLALSGVQAYWPLDDPSGGTLSGGVHYCREASGLWTGDTNLWFPFNGIAGTLAAPSILPAVGSTSFHKTTAGWSFQAPWSGLTTSEKAAIAQPGPLTFCCWLNPDSILGDASGDSWIWGEWSGWNVKLNFETAVTAGAAVTTSRAFLPFNTYFLAETYDRTNAYAYINGVLVATQPLSAAVTYGTNAVELGGILGTNGFTGYMQKVAWFSAALSQAQLQALYVVGAASVAESAGENMNVYPFSRQATVTAPATLCNDSDTPMYVSLGDTSDPAAPHQGARINANGGVWATPAGYGGPLQICHSAPLGSKTVLFS